MAFEIQSVNLDRIARQATVLAQDQSSDPIKVVNLQFPYEPGGSDDWNDAIAAAKTILQQALTDLSASKKARRKR